MRFIAPHRKNERGVTILIVGITLLVLIAMAALAIDVASLYQAHSEAQRAADAAALAGAKMFVTSGYTSNPTGWSFNRLCRSGGPGLNAAANRQAEAVASQNLIAGQPAALKTIACAPPAIAQNPQITVTVQRVGAPTFFAKIWGTASSTVTATATAEAFNPSGRSLPIGLSNVKPWLIPNCDPNGSSGPCDGVAGHDPPFFVNPSDGTITTNADSYIGSEIQFSRATTGGIGGGGSSLSFYGLIYPNPPAPLMPAAGAQCGFPVNAGDDYIDNIAGVSGVPLYCGQQIGPANTPLIQTIVNSPVSSQPTIEGTQCLIHANGNGLDQGQDVFTSSMPVTISGGSNNPNPAFRGVANISRSDAIVTALLYDGHQMCFGRPGDHACSNPSPQPATVIGFLQLAVEQTGGGFGGGGGQTFTAVVVNAVGCSQDAINAYPPAPASTISPGSSSPVLVRLVQSP
jgi:hypothetical protein